MRTVYVLAWHYSDKSDFGIVRVYAEEETALSDLAMLREHSGTKQFEVHTQFLVE